MLTLTSPVETPLHRLPAGAKLTALAAVALVPLDSLPLLAPAALATALLYGAQGRAFARHGLALLRPLWPFLPDPRALARLDGRVRPRRRGRAQASDRGGAGQSGDHDHPARRYDRGARTGGAAAATGGPCAAGAGHLHRACHPLHAGATCAGRAAGRGLARAEPPPSLVADRGAAGAGSPRRCRTGGRGPPRPGRPLGERDRWNAT